MALNKFANIKQHGGIFLSSFFSIRRAPSLDIIKTPEERARFAVPNTMAPAGFRKSPCNNRTTQLAGEIRKYDGVNNFDI